MFCIISSKQFPQLCQRWQWAMVSWSGALDLAFVLNTSSLPSNPTHNHLDDILPWVFCRGWHLLFQNPNINRNGSPSVKSLLHGGKHFRS